MINVITLIPTEPEDVTIASLPIGTMFSYLHGDNVYMKIARVDGASYSTVNLATGSVYKSDGLAKAEVRKAVKLVAE